MASQRRLSGTPSTGAATTFFWSPRLLTSNASLKGTLRACDASLTRLRTDHLDCYLLRWRGEHPLGETSAAFEQLRREGKILFWGVSNFDVSDLEDARPLAGEGGLVCNQVL
jgi:diketogulonate reductase-like aldo/keto reductase